MAEIRKLSTIEEITAFQKKFNGVLKYSCVPVSYFKSGDCFGLYEGRDLVGGFCLVPGFDNLRSIQQLPKNIRKGLRSIFFNSLCDFTGYFITTKNKWDAFKFTLFLVKTCWFYKSKYFIYSYQISEVGLGKYYGAGNPIRVYTDKPIALPGHSEEMEEEHVEILERVGIVKIFLYRIKRVFKKWK